MITLKRELGLSGRIKGVLDNGVGALLEKPILVIGHCSLDDARDILGGVDQWGPLIRGIKSVASALIVCGQDGCDLSLADGRQKLVF